MIEAGWQLLVVLAVVAFAAGFIDAIAGGGGLLTVPALLLAGLDPVSAVATNKLQSTFGSAAATLAFSRRGFLSSRTALPLAVAAGLGAIAGASLLPFVPRRAMEIALPVALMAVAGYFALSPRFGQISRPASSAGSLGLAAAVPVVGFYDGIFGPGTGSFYMFAYISLGGFGLLEATARTKATNFASNLAGLGAYLFAGNVAFQIGLVMAAAQLAGGWLGAQLSINSGGRWVRPAVVTMSALLACKLLVDALRT